MGEVFEVHSEISAWAFADFAKAMKSNDGDTVGAESVTAMMDLLRDCVIAEEWPRFEAVTRAKRATFPDLMKVVQDMTEARAERPTGRPSDSSDGSLSTDPKSELSSADKALAESGLRADQKLAILRARDVA